VDHGIFAQPILAPRYGAAISAQQFSTVSLIAKEIDRSILERLSIAESLAGSLSADTLASPPRPKP
jgi:hypothetical protein